MKASVIVKSLMKTNNLRQIDMQERLGLKSQSQVSIMLRSDMRVSSLVRLLDAMGYILVIKKAPTHTETEEDENECYTVTE